jgi:uncharacterized protein YuzE
MVQAMKIQYFQDPDTLYIEFRAHDIVETRDLDPGTVLDLDRHGKVCAITFEQASLRADKYHVIMEGIAA